MATKINLLPTELGANKEIVRLATTLRQIAYVLVALFLLAGMGAGGYIFFLSDSRDRLATSRERLSSQIKTMSSAEQSYFLLKDRLAKAKTITAEHKLEESLLNLEALVVSLPQGVSFTEAEFGSTKSEFSFISTSSLGLVEFLAKVVSGDTYKSILLKNFSFNQNLGYVITLEVTQ